MAFKSSANVKPFENHIYLSSPTMHGEEARYMMEAYETNWMSTVGRNINEIEAQIAERIGQKYAVALSAGTAALHLGTRLAGETLYGRKPVHEGTLAGKTVFCTDTTFDASVNPVAYENGEAVFIDTEADTWNMDPEALEKAFALYPDTRLIAVAHLYGTPGKIAEIREICSRHGALIVEDAAESLGAQYLLDGEWRETGSFGDFNCISFNGNKIITGSAGGMFLTDSKEDADRVRKWSTQSRENAPWYQHEELGYNYRMSNVIAGVIRGQLPHLQEHMDQKRAIYERYRDGLRDLPVKMNPYDAQRSKPNFWLSCMTINEEAMCCQERGDKKARYYPEKGKSCPTEILETLAQYNAEGRPVWKPMHAQPIYRAHPFVTREGRINDSTDDVGMDIFRRGLCLPSDNKMSAEQQDRIIELIHLCFL